MLGPEQALQERVAMTGVALLVRPPLVAFQTLARGLVLVFKMPFIEALLLLLHLLGIVLLLAALDPLLVPLAVPAWPMTCGTAPPRRRTISRKRNRRNTIAITAANFMPSPGSYLCPAQQPRTITC